MGIRSSLKHLSVAKKKKKKQERNEIRYRSLHGILLGISCSGKKNPTFKAPVVNIV